MSSATSAQHLVTNYGQEARDRYWALFEDLRAHAGLCRLPGRACSATGWRTCTTRTCCASPTGWRTIRSPSGCIRARWTRCGTSRQWGPTVILSDGDAAFQPRKVERSGLWRTFADNVLIYVHKEQALDDVERLYPARGTT